MDIKQLRPKKRKTTAGVRYIVDQRSLQNPGPEKFFLYEEEAYDYIENLKKHSSVLGEPSLHWSLARVHKKYIDEIEADQRTKNLVGKKRSLLEIMDLKVKNAKIKNMLVRDVDTRMIQLYVVDVLAKGRTTKTLKGYVTHLAQLFDKAVFGAGDDLEIYHSGSHSIIKDGGTGNLQINAGNLNINNVANSANIIALTQGSKATLYTLQHLPVTGLLLKIFLYYSFAFFYRCLLPNAQSLLS